MISKGYFPKKFYFYKFASKCLKFQTVTHLLKEKIKNKDFTKLDSYENRFLISSNIVEDNFKKLLWKRLYSTINDEIRLKSERYDIEKKELQNSQNSKEKLKNEKMEYLKKLYKIIIFFKLLNKTHCKKKDFIGHKIINECIIDLFFKLVEDYKNIRISEKLGVNKESENEESIKINNCFIEIVLFLIEINYVDKEYFILIKKDRLYKLLWDNEVLETEKVVINSFQIDDKMDYVSSDKKKKKKSKLKNHFNILDDDKNKDYLKLNISQLLGMLFFSKKLDVHNLYNNLMNVKQNGFSENQSIFKRLNTDSKYKIILFFSQIIKEFYFFSDLIKFTVDKETYQDRNQIKDFLINDDISNNYNKFYKNLFFKKKFKIKNFEKSQLEKEELYPTIVYLLNFKYNNQLNKKTFINRIEESKIEMNEVKKKLYKLAVDYFRLSYIYNNQEKNIYLISIFVGDILFFDTDNKKDTFNLIFFELINKILNFDDLHHIHPELVLENNQIIKSFVNIFETFNNIFSSYANHKEDSREILEEYFNIYLKFYDKVFLMKLKNILKRHLFTPLEILQIFKIIKFVQNIYLVLKKTEYFNTIYKKKFHFIYFILLSKFLNIAFDKIFKAYCRDNIQFLTYVLHLFYTHLNDEAKEFFLNIYSDQYAERVYGSDHDYLNVLIKSLNYVETYLENVLFEKNKKTFFIVNFNNSLGGIIEDLENFKKKAKKLNPSIKYNIILLTNYRKKLNDCLKKMDLFDKNK